MEQNRHKQRKSKVYLESPVQVAAATIGDIFDRLVVIFLKCTFRRIRAARLGASLPIKEIGPDGRSSIGLPLLLTIGGRLSTCLEKRE